MCNILKRVLSISLLKLYATSNTALKVVLVFLNFVRRHHIGEVKLTYVWNALKIEASYIREISLFLVFREKFPALTYSDKADVDILECPPGLQSSKDQIIAFCTDFTNKGFDRRDYRELVSLTLLFLNAYDKIHHSFQ